MHTHTSTYAFLFVAPATFEDIKSKLDREGVLDTYLDDNRIIMNGLALVAEPYPHASGDLHPSVQNLLQFFEFEHLPSNLQLISRPFCLMARDLAHSLPGNPETTVCLRKLLEAKDCAVRAALKP